MSIQDNIENEAKSSSSEVLMRAQDEVDEDERRKRIKNDKKEQDKDERKVYANLVFTLVSVWLTMVLLIVLNAGLQKLFYSDIVLVTLITTSTANVIVLFALIIKDLFNPKPRK